MLVNALDIHEFDFEEKSHLTQTDNLWELFPPKQAEKLLTIFLFDQLHNMLLLFEGLLKQQEKDFRS